MLNPTKTAHAKRKSAPGTDDHQTSRRRVCRRDADKPKSSNERAQPNGELASEIYVGPVAETSNVTARCSDNPTSMSSACGRLPLPTTLRVVRCCLQPKSTTVKGTRDTVRTIPSRRPKMALHPVNDPGIERA